MYTVRRRAGAWARRTDSSAGGRETVMRFSPSAVAQDLISVNDPRGLTVTSGTRHLRELTGTPAAMSRDRPALLNSSYRVCIYGTRPRRSACCSGCPNQRSLFRRGAMVIPCSLSAFLPDARAVAAEGIFNQNVFSSFGSMRAPPGGRSRATERVRHAL